MPHSLMLFTMKGNKDLQKIGMIVIHYITSVKPFYGMVKWPTVLRSVHTPCYLLCKLLFNCDCGGALMLRYILFQHMLPLLLHAVTLRLLTMTCDGLPWIATELEPLHRITLQITQSMNRHLDGTFFGLSFTRNKICLLCKFQHIQQIWVNYWILTFFLILWK